MEELLDVLDGFLPQGPQLFPEDMVTDQPERQMMAEILRGEAAALPGQGDPHGTAVEITKFSERDDEVIEIDATIYCEKNSHKGIIIGKGGAMLKKVSSLARQDMERFMGTKVYLHYLAARLKEGEEVVFPPMPPPGAPGGGTLPPSVPGMMDKKDM